MPPGGSPWADRCEPNLNFAPVAISATRPAFTPSHGFGQRKITVRRIIGLCTKVGLVTTATRPRRMTPRCVTTTPGRVTTTRAASAGALMPTPSDVIARAPRANFAMSFICVLLALLALPDSVLRRFPHTLLTLWIRSSLQPVSDGFRRSRSAVMVAAATTATARCVTSAAS